MRPDPTRVRPVRRAGHVLVARLDNAGDVLLCGPAVRAVAASCERVTFLAGPAGAAAAELLPGVDTVMTWEAPWVGFRPPGVDRDGVDAFVARLAAAAIDAAVVLTSFHQSPLPLALLLRMAGIAHVVATSVDYPGSLLDVRVDDVPEWHEVEQSLATCTAAGFPLPRGDDAGLRLAPLSSSVRLPEGPYVLVHPGASVEARALPVAATAEAVSVLTRRGWNVVLTGGPGEVDAARAIGASAAPGMLDDRTGGTDLAQLAELVAGAEVVVCGNTGPAHLAAAVGTPVVVAFAPTVPAHRWRPWKVPHILIGDQDISCAGCRARTCPVPGQPCLDPVTAAALVDAVERLAHTRSRLTVTNRIETCPTVVAS